MNGDNFNHLIHQIDSRLERIERAVEKQTEAMNRAHSEHAGRIDSLEKTRDEQKGMTRVLIGLSGLVGAVLTTAFSKLWNWNWS